MNSEYVNNANRFPVLVSVRLTTKEAQKVRLLERLNALPANHPFPEHPHRILLRLLELGLRQVESQTALTAVVGCSGSVVDSAQTEIPCCRICGGGGDLVVAGGVSLCPTCFGRLGAKAA